MSFQTAAIVAGVAFLLSFLSGLIGGVPLGDVFLRALIWSIVGFGGCLGAEALLRSLVPDLFASQEASPVPDEPTGQAVNITLEEEMPRGGFVEEVGDEDEVAAPRARTSPVGELPVSASAPVPEVREAPRSSEAAAGPSDDEEMPEIGSFLDAFKPESTDPEEGSGAAPSPGYSEYAPDTSRSSAGEVTIDGEAQDPVILAKAVQTVMKRDTQGN